MSFDNKLIADYTELINEELDNIAVNTMEEYGLISTALQRLLPPASGIWGFFLYYLNKLLFPAPPPTPLPKHIEERVSMVKYYLESPEDYVALPENYAEYQQILVRRIKAKIAEFESFDSIQRENYIKNLAAKRYAMNPSLQLLEPKLSFDSPHDGKEFEFDICEDGSEPEHHGYIFEEEEPLPHFQINMDGSLNCEGTRRWGL